MERRFISHSDGPPADLNVDDIWTTLVRETRQVCYESANAASDPDALSIYHGSAGFAVFARLVSSFNDLGPPLDRLGRENLETSLEQISQNCLPNIVKLLEAAKWRPKSSSKTSFLETPVGIAAEVLIDTMESQNPNSYKKQEISSCIDVLHRGLKIQAQETDEDEDEGCEVLYGQAGLLYALLRLLDRIDSAAPEVTNDLKLETFVNKTSIANIVHSIIIRGRFGASVYASNVSSRLKVPSLMWSWHHKRYLGAAHGVAGILHIILMCPMDIISPYIPDILQTIEWLTTCQDDEGNWPSSIKQEYPRSNDLMQWCHGAPGLLILFTTLIRRAHAYPDLFRLSESFQTGLATAVQQGAAIVYERGLLCKGVGLCHGVGGSVFALLACSDALGLWKRYDHSKVYFLSAIHLAHLATAHAELTSSGEMKFPEKPWSLYGGIAGMCCAWAEVYERLCTTGRNLDQLEYSWCRIRSGMPGFDDINFRQM